ncbi:MAG: hypothetical protein ACQ5SW_04535 [Sphaerochaetaceae bacterium]
MDKPNVEGTQNTCTVTLRSRYNFMVHQNGNILSYLDQGQISTIAKVLSTLEDDSFALLYPFSFADLHLQAYPEISTIYDALEFPRQCQTLDIAREFGKEGPCQALVAVDYQTGLSTVLSLGKNKKELAHRAFAYVNDPLVKTLIDEDTEKELVKLLTNIRFFLPSLQKQENQRYACCAVTCSEEFFLSYLFTILLDVPFALEWGPEKDSWGRYIPTYLRSENAWSLESSH